MQAFKRSVIAPIVSALVAWTAAAQAQPTFNVQTRFDAGCSSSTFSSGVVDSPVSHSDSCGDSQSAAALFASSSPGVVRSSTNSSTNDQLANSQATALARFSDLITFTKTDPNAPDVFTVALNLNLDGILNAGQGISPQGFDPFPSRAGYSFAVQGDFGNYSGLGTFSTVEGVTVIPSGLGDNFGVIAPGSNGFALALQSPQIGFNFAGASSLDAFLFIALESFADSRGDGGSARADFSSSFGFPVGTDVFTLPAGYTANAGAYLVNNRFIDPNAVGGVPEPRMWALLILGFGMVGGALRRRMAVLA